MTRKEILFSLTARDFDWSYTKGSGAGGQKRNKTSSAVHCMHRPSGASGYSESSRSQADNKAEAFEKCANSAKFRAWLAMEMMRKSGQLAEIDRMVEREMTKIRIEHRDEAGNWVEWTDEHAA